MKNYQIRCPYCGAAAAMRPAGDIYGYSPQSKGKHLYVCTNWPVCDSYVAAHKDDLRPMGTMANGELRHKRILAHKALDSYQKATHMNKWAGYVWLQVKLGMEPDKAHIAMFSEEECDRVIDLCRNAVKSYRTA